MNTTTPCRGSVRERNSYGRPARSSDKRQAWEARRNRYYDLTFSDRKEKPCECKSQGQ